MYACVSVRTCAVAKQTFSVAVAVASCARSFSVVQSSSLISHDAAYVARRYFHRDLSMPQRPFYVTANFAYFLIHIFHRLFIDIYECGLVKRSIASVCRSCYDSTFWKPWQLEPRNFSCGMQVRLHRIWVKSYIKVIGPRSRSQEQKFSNERN